MREAVICEPLRTPVGGFGGSLRDVPAHELAVTVARELMARTKLPGDAVEDVIMGNCYPTMDAPAFGRVVALDAGLPITTTGLQLDRRVGAAAGWPSINVVDLRIDAHKRVWIFGSDGLWRFDPDSGRFRVMGLQDGLANGEFFRGYSRLEDGTIYSPTFGGVVGFNPDLIDDRQGTPPLLAITSSARWTGTVNPGTASSITPAPRRRRRRS